MAAQVAPRPGASRPDEPDDVDMYGPDSFPASDPPSSWWGGEVPARTPTVEPKPEAGDPPEETTTT